MNSRVVDHQSLKQKILFLLQFLSLIGIGVSIALTQHFYDVRNGKTGFQSSCNLSASVNCDVVAASSCAELLPGISRASASAGWFLALFLLSICALRQSWRREAIQCMGFLMITGVCMSTLSFYLMTFKLKTYCLLCLVVIALIGLSLLCFLQLKERRLALMWSEIFSKKLLHLKKIMGFFILMISCLGFSVWTLQVLDDQEFSTEQVQSIVQSILKTPVVTFPSGFLSQDPTSVGPVTAPITIIKFSDFQCPPCKRAAFMLHSLLLQYPEKIRILYKNFPLDAKCNPLFSETIHPLACEAAQIALCAQQEGKFEAIYQNLFQQQVGLQREKLFDIAKQAGLNVTQLHQCMQSSKINHLLKNEIQEAIAMGIQGTPVFFINGHQVEGCYPAKVWHALVEKLL